MYDAWVVWDDLSGSVAQGNKREPTRS